MTKYIALFLFLVNISFAENKIENVAEKINANVDCLILEDENSIICKFEAVRDEIDQDIIINWINPAGEVSRSREMVIPSGDISVYDYRYLDGRESGKWNFVVKYKGREYSTHFELK